MEKIKGITFAPFAAKGILATQTSYESLKKLKETTNATHVIFVPAGIQQTAESEEIDYKSTQTMSDQELTDMIHFAQGLGLKVILKPTVNCANGVWRAHIHFFDMDVPCEPKWSNWFASYQNFMLHYAYIAQKTGCVMFITGCEMVMTEHRQEEWRSVIAAVKEVYQGLVSYNTDKYQEDHVKWWDALDVISSSGYYPIHDWKNQLDRIEKVVKKYKKPFFFAEAGCMSISTSPMVPNDWNQKGDTNQKAQSDYYKTMFTACEKRDWVEGFGLWSWDSDCSKEGLKGQEKGYEIFQKEALIQVADFYKNWKS